jgi:hypothetical protein
LSGCDSFFRAFHRRSFRAFSERGATAPRDAS